jgi:hypothetical protein
VDGAVGRAGSADGNGEMYAEKSAVNQPNPWTHGMTELGRREYHYGTRTEVYITEAIGERVIEGVRATGVRTTKTVIDSATNKQETLVTEIWYSAELKEMVVMKAVPAQVGFPDFELKKVDRSEPDPKLFYPPVGYKIEHHKY